MCLSDVLGVCERGGAGRAWRDGMACYTARGGYQGGFSSKVGLGENGINGLDWILDGSCHITV
jgi:hypothetical protein